MREHGASGHFLHVLFFLPFPFLFFFLCINSHSVRLYTTTAIEEQERPHVPEGRRGYHLLESFFLSRTDGIFHGHHRSAGARASLELPQQSTCKVKTPNLLESAVKLNDCRPAPFVNVLDLRPRIL